MHGDHRSRGRHVTGAGRAHQPSPAGSAYSRRSSTRSVSRTPVALGRLQFVQQLATGHALGRPRSAAHPGRQPATAPARRPADGPADAAASARRRRTATPSRRSARSWQQLITSTSRVRGPQRSSAHPLGRLLQLLRPPQPAASVGGRVVDDQHRVEETALLDAAPRRGLVHRRHRRTAAPRPSTADCSRASRSPRLEPIDSTARVMLTCRRDSPNSPRRSRRDRRATTATSANVSGIGACGLCTVTSTACTRASLITSSAISAATVSIRSRAGPATIAAARCASSRSRRCRPGRRWRRRRPGPSTP